MNNDLKQYIDFYHSQRDAILEHSTAVMNARRAEALSSLECAGRFPTKGSEEYHITDAGAMFAPDYGINANRVGIQVDVAQVFNCDVPNLSSLLYLQFNDVFQGAVRDNESFLPKGVVIDSICHAATTHHELIAERYGARAPISDPVVALNTLLAQDGIFIYIPRGVVMPRPVQIVSVLNGSMPLLASRRVLIIADEGASAKFIFCDHTQSAGVQFATNQVSEIYLGAGANVDIYDMEESSADTARMASSYVYQERDSSFLSNSITLMNGRTRNNIAIDVAGAGCTTKLYGISIGREEECIDNHTHIAHNAPRCHSRELYKYLLEGNSTGAFGGKIYVSPGADKVEAYQSNANILGSERARIFTKPQLEIYTDDVKCSHGATTGQLDANALFYMRTRGIPEEEARALLMQAFMDEVIETVTIDSLRDRLKLLIEKRLRGTLARCGECGMQCSKKQEA